MAETKITTIKLTKKVKRRLHVFKERLISSKRRRITDNEAVLEAVRRAEKSERPIAEREFPLLSELVGFIKGGKPFSSAKETDKIVYEV